MQSNLQPRNLQNASWLGVSDMIHVPKGEFNRNIVRFVLRIMKGLNKNESCTVEGHKGS